MYDFRPRTLGNSAVRLSETVRKSAREPSRNPSRALFGQSDKFGSARLSVGQTKKFWPRLSRRSDNPRIFVRMSTPGLGILSCPKTCNRSCFLFLQACPETCLNFGPKKKPVNWSVQVFFFILVIFTGTCNRNLFQEGKQGLKREKRPF